MGDLTTERLRELLHYEPETGVFTWRVRKRGIRFGSIAGTNTGRGYVQIRVDGGIYYAHRLAWMYVYGLLPTEEIDHVDGCRSNNAILNLRECSHKENLQNLAATRRNTSGLLGVSWSQRGKGWLAQITVNGRNRNLGTFDTPEKAHAAYLAAKQQLHLFQPTPRTTKTKASNDQTYQTAARG